MKLQPKDLRIDTYSEPRKGGWSTKRDNGVRITHIPTGLVVRAHGEPSQEGNKAVALEALHAMLLDKESTESSNPVDMVVNWAVVSGLGTPTPQAAESLLRHLNEAAVLAKVASVSDAVLWAIYWGPNHICTPTVFPSLKDAEEYLNKIAPLAKIYWIRPPITPLYAAPQQSPKEATQQRIADLEDDVKRLHADKIALMEKYVYAFVDAAQQPDAGEPVDKWLETMHTLCEPLGLKKAGALMAHARKRLMIVKGVPVAYRFRHSAEERWHYGEREENWWQHEPLFTLVAPVPPPQVAQGDERAAALTWYAEHVEGCRKIGSAGDAYRHALDKDGGERARAALATKETK